MPNTYYQELFFYPDEKLIEIVTAQREEFVPEVVTAAEHLLRERNFEITFESRTDLLLQVQVRSQAFEVEKPEQVHETARSIALLFAAIIFGVLGLIIGIGAIPTGHAELFYFLLFLLPSFICLYLRKRVKISTTRP